MEADVAVAAPSLTAEERDELARWALAEVGAARGAMRAAIAQRREDLPSFVVDQIVTRAFSLSGELRRIRAAEDSAATLEGDYKIQPPKKKQPPARKPPLATKRRVERPAAQPVDKSTAVARPNEPVPLMKPVQHRRRLTHEARDALRASIHELLEAEPKIGAEHAFRRLSPEVALKSFERHFDLVVQARAGGVTAAEKTPDSDAASSPPKNEEENRTPPAPISNETPTLELRSIEIRRTPAGTYSARLVLDNLSAETATRLRSDMLRLLVGHDG